MEFRLSFRNNLWNKKDNKRSSLWQKYLRAALCVRVTLQDVSHHRCVSFLHCPVEGSLSILKRKDFVIF